jgi:hypothetical protein
LVEYWIHKLKKGPLTKYARRHHAIKTVDHREVIDMPKLANRYPRMNTHMKRAFNAAMRLRGFHMKNHMAQEVRAKLRRMNA